MIWHTTGFWTLTSPDSAVRQARALSLSLEEIKEIIDLRRRGTCPCGTVTRLLDQHLERVERTLDDLKGLRHTLLQAKAHLDVVV